MNHSKADLAPQEAAKVAAAALAGLGIHSTLVSIKPDHVVLQVPAGDLLTDLGQGTQGYRTGVPAYVGSIAIRYRIETGQMLGPHPS